MRGTAPHRIYPFFAITSSILILVGSLLLAKKEGYWFLLAMMIILVAFNMGKTLLKVAPIAILLSGIYFGIAYAISKDINEGIFGAIRIGGVCLAVIPGLSVPGINLSRALQEVRAPRAVSLSMLITMRFFPLLGREIATIRTAMRTRGIPPSPMRFYRSVLLPFCLKLITISDLLSLSLETRGYGIIKRPTTWKRVLPRWVDFLFLSLVVALFALSLIYFPLGRYFQ